MEKGYGAKYWWSLWGVSPQKFWKMQIKIISVPMVGGEWMNDELNRFLRGHKVLQVEQQLVSGTAGAYWAFCIRYVDDQGRLGNEKKERVDYRAVLSVVDFAKFSKLRSIRKAIAEAEGIPAFAVLTDEEMAGLAQLAELTPQTMQSVKGIGEKKSEKYATRFIKAMTDETGQ